jgi:hypothetical protein
VKRLKIADANSGGIDPSPKEKSIDQTMNPHYGIGQFKLLLHIGQHNNMYLCWWMQGCLFLLNESKKYVKKSLIKAWFQLCKINYKIKATIISHVSDQQSTLGGLL